MLRSRRKAMVILMGALGLLAMAGGAIAIVSAYQLPAPQEANREQLVRWLATRELEHESYDVRAALITRLQDELDAGVNLEAIDEQIDERSEIQLRENLDVLLRQWFLELSNDYWQTDAGRRNALIDQQLERLKRWRLAEYMAADSARITEVRSNPLQALAELSLKLQQWCDSAEPEQRTQAREFAQIVQARVAWNAIATWNEKETSD